MLILSSVEYRPSYDQFDLDPYITKCYNDALTTLKQYVGDGTEFEVQKINAHLCISIQGESKGLDDDELDIDADLDSECSPNTKYKELLEILQSGDYCVDEMKVVVKHPTHSVIYVIREVQ